VYTGYSITYFKREELPLYDELISLVARTPQLIMC
jgi:hypothetical protein